MNSPQIQIVEASQQHYIPNVTGETACFVGYFERGPIDVPVYITSVDEFKFIFGRGVDDSYNDWYQVYNYLQYSTGIWVARSSGPRLNANNGAVLTIDRYSQWEDQYSTIVPDPVRFIARTPGAWGNLLSIGVISKAEYDSDVTIGHNLSAKNIFNFFEDGYFGICVFRDGLLVETFYIPFGDLETLNTDSKYIYTKIDNSVLPVEILEIIDFLDNSGTLDMGTLEAFTSIDDLGTLSNMIFEIVDLGFISSDDAWTPYLFYDNTLIQFNNGLHQLPSNDEMNISYDLFADPNYFDIDIVIGNDRNNAGAIRLAETRKDCMAFIGFPTDIVQYLKLLMGTGQPSQTAYTPDGIILALSEFKISNNMTQLVLNEIDAYIDSIPESIYAHFTMNVKVQYDYFTNKYKLVNLAGDTAGLKAQASLISPWTVGAGLERGQIKNLNGMYMNLSKVHKDRYYKKGLNYTGAGALATQKTFTTKLSSFNKVNVRSLFNHIEKETKYILRSIVFDENTIQQRQKVATLLKMYLKDIKTNRGIENAQVHVYPNSKTEIGVDVLVKPTYIAETINIRITNAGTNEFSNVVS